METESQTGNALCCQLSSVVLLVMFTDGER